MEKVNELSFERIKLVDEYVQLSKQLDSYLSSARFNFSKAKTLHGVTLTGLADPDSLDLVASIRINDSKDKYNISESKQEESEVKSRKPVKNESTEEKSADTNEIHLQNNAFRPFGVLEPMAAKEGRKTILSAIKIICDMATTQKAIKKIDQEMITAMKNVDIETIFECLKI